VDVPRVCLVTRISLVDSLVVRLSMFACRLVM
jgi:hypothetical protein